METVRGHMPFYNQLSDSSNFVSNFTRDPIEDLGVYSRGYKFAADSLTKELLEKAHFPDYEAYPVVFLYRHALELSLKHVVSAAALLAKYTFRSDVACTFERNHEIKPLAISVVRICKKLFPKDTTLQEKCALIRETCGELSDLDPESFSYRYPIKKNNLPSTKHHQIVNLRSFSERMSAVLDDLETLHFGLEVETALAEEVYRILESEYGSI